MIRSIATLVCWEWFKLIRRWMPWVLLILLLLMSQLPVWGSYVTYRSFEHSGGEIAPTVRTGRPSGISCRDVLSGRTENLPAGTTTNTLLGEQEACREENARIQQRLAVLYDGFSLPGSIPNALNLGTLVGLVLLAILAASHVGTEYGWGTVRPILTRGTGRHQFIAGKMLALALIAGAALVIVVVTTMLSSAIAVSLTTHPVQVASTATVGAAAIALLKSWIALVAYLLFVICITVFTRSSAAGIAIGIVYYIAEQILVAILSGLFGWFGNVAKYLLGQNIAAWARLSLSGPSESNVSSTHALLVLLAYAIALVAITLTLFNRRDVFGASGS